MKMLLFGSLISAGMVAATAHQVPSQWMDDLSDRFPFDHLIQTDVTLITSPVTADQQVKTVTVTGSLEATANVNVGSQLSGLLAKVNVDFNSTVHKGDVLAELDDRSFRADVDHKNAALAAARNAVESARLDYERAELAVKDTQSQKAVLDARVERARAELDLATKDADRKVLLQERAAGSLADADNAKYRKAAALAAEHEAVAIRTAQDNSGTEALKDVERARAQMESAKFAVAQAEALLASSRVDLERTRIRAPIDGVIVSRSVVLGETLATSLETKTLFVLAGDLEKMNIYARVDESDIGMVKVGQEARFKVDAFPGQLFSARVEQIRKQPVVLQNVVTYTVVLSAANPDLTLLPGMTAQIDIIVGQSAASLHVPSAALHFTPSFAAQSADDQPGVWVKREDGSLQRVPVRLGQDDGGAAIINADGLTPGTPVAIAETRGAKAIKLLGLRLRI